MPTTRYALFGLTALTLAIPGPASAAQRVRTSVHVTTPTVQVSIPDVADVVQTAVRAAVSATVHVAPVLATSFQFGPFVRFYDLDDTPPPAWDGQDPADSLYRAGREALNRNEYLSASGLFQEIRTRYPRSSYAPDAYYWQAYALYRRGGTNNMQTAVDLLDQQATRFPNAATRNDAPALSARLLGELARQGDADAERRIRAEVATVVVPSGTTVISSPSVSVSVNTPRRGRSRDRSADRQCRDDGDDLRMMAVNSLLNMDADQAIPILKQVLARRDSASLCLRRKAVFLVAQHDSRESGQILLDAIRNDPDPEVRAQAVFWLSQVEGDEAVDALQNVLRTTQDRDIQDKAIFALSQHEGARASQVLRGYAENAQNPSELREKAIFWLGQQGGSESVQFLQQLYGRVQDAKLRERIIFAVSQSDGGAGGRWLTEIAKNPNESVDLRKKAIFWAGQRDDTPVAELVSLYGSLPNRELKEQLLFVMSQRDTKESVDKLVEIVRTERDTDLRRRALFWLGQTNDPRVAQLIAEILEKP